MKTIFALFAGLAGATALTVTHQLLKEITHNAPQMDLMGEEAIVKSARKAKLSVPDNLYATTMAADIAVNTLYYAVAGIGKAKSPIIRGSFLGLIAGIGAVYLPSPLGLTNAFSNRTLPTKMMTVGIYTLGGIVTGAILSFLGKKYSKTSS